MIVTRFPFCAQGDRGTRARQFAAIGRARHPQQQDWACHDRRDRIASPTEGNFRDRVHLQGRPDRGAAWVMVSLT